MIRYWYAAVDSAGIDIDERITFLMDKREFLLKQYNPMIFPPPGSYVNSLPIAQFEGISTNVDRRLQLYSMVQTGAYNHRSLSSLDSETFFSSFQDIDPKGTGVLRADDIESALTTACFLNDQRLKDDRNFNMTTARACVYKHEAFSTMHVQRDDEVVSAPTMDTITIRPLSFDEKQRQKQKPKRKSGTISQSGVVARGATGVRVHHKVNEENIGTSPTRIH